MKILRPLLTEKTMAQIERENRLLFLVTRDATKPEIKKEVEKLYGMKVRSVNTHIARTGKKRAYVRFEKKDAALDISTKLGMI